MITNTVYLNLRNEEINLKKANSRNCNDSFSTKWVECKCDPIATNC